MTDITQEFLDVVREQSLTIIPNLDARRERPAAAAVASLREFHAAAADIGAKIGFTSRKISQLISLVRQTTMFNHPEAQINGLVHSVREDITSLNAQMEAAQAFVEDLKTRKATNAQGAQHSLNVVNALRNDLSSTAATFKDALQKRTDSLRQLQKREGEVGVSTADQSVLLLGAPTVYKPISNALPRPAGVAPSGRDELAPLPSPWAMPADGPLVTQQQQMEQVQLIPDQSYLESRAAAMTEVEGSITELSQLFNRLATIISDQQEAVERIVDNVDLTAENMQIGQAQLLRALRTRFSDRNLVVKVFSIFILFIVLFIVFVA
mmetsp:Transcript_950/g.3993  ORF Transcript_950/g.3993 Transcript_950/m.3993 type:complete len:323 (-) Transcript_950:449-1417(-)